MKAKRIVKNCFSLIGVFILLLAWPLKASPLDWKMEWEKTLTAAKAEGKVVVAGPPGEIYREILREFSKAYPDIQLDYVGADGPVFAPRIMSERRAGQFLWDLYIGGMTTAFNTLIPAQAVDPLRPALILPEILLDKTWRGGFDDGWMDTEKKYVYSFISYVQYIAFVNRDVVPETEFTKAEDLWDPKWKGKIVYADPRSTGTGTTLSTVILVNFGEKALRRLFKDQALVIAKDYRQIAEWVVRGRYPIGIGVESSHLKAFQREGLGKNVHPLKDPKIATTSGAFGSVILINRAPHPNAAKVYLNWLLSKEAQSIYAKNAGHPSRRLDVLEGDPVLRPQPGIHYLTPTKQEYQAQRNLTIQIAKEMLQ